MTLKIQGVIKIKSTDVTTITAVWGAVTGSLSLLWNIYSKKLEKPRLKVQLSKRFQSFICPPQLFYDKSTNFSQPLGVINVLLINKGAGLESIHNIVYYNAKYKKWFPICQDDFYIKRMDEEIGNGVTLFHELPVGKQIELPLDLQGYQSQEYKFFITLPKNVVANKKLKFKFLTSQRKYRFSFRIQSLDHILPGWRKYKIAE